MRPAHPDAGHNLFTYAFSLHQRTHESLSAPHRLASPTPPASPFLLSTLVALDTSRLSAPRSPGIWSGSFMERSRVVRSRASRWADLPPELLVTIFSQAPDWKTISRVCVGWKRVILSLARPVVLCPISEYSPPDPLPFAPVRMRLLVPIVATPRGAGASRSINEATRLTFRYLTVPIRSICSEMRLIGGSSGLPLFVDDRSGRLVIPRLTSPHQPGPRDSETAMVLELPGGVDSEEVYIGSLAVSRSYSDVPCPLLGISAVAVATRSCLLGLRTGRHRQVWSMLHVTEPAEGHSFEQPGLRTFVSILFDTSESAYLLDASRRLSFMRWNAAGRLQMQELPIQGGPNALLDGGIEELRMVWLLQLPLLDRNGTNLVCLAYRWFSSFKFGRFMRFDLEEAQATRLWVMRLNILGDLCLLVSWGPGALAFVYKQPERIGLSKGRIYSSQNGLQSYIMNWSYNDLVKVPSYWPFPIWIDPEFPNPLSLEDTVTVEDSPAGDMVEQLEISGAATTATSTAPTDPPTPLVDRFIRQIFLQL